ncbi:MAG: hypothetical protein IJK74_04185 [Bacteroidales bacterium]|nr:hypothetical protein [Bacteroidales bacterium]
MGKTRRYAWILLTVMLLAGLFHDRGGEVTLSSEDGISTCVLGQGQRPVSDAHQTYLVTVPSVVEASLSSRISIAELNCAFEGGVRVHCKVFSVKQPVPSNSGQRLNFLKVLRI